MSTSSGLNQDRSEIHKRHFGSTGSAKQFGYTTNASGFTYYNTNAPINKVRQATVAPTITTSNIAI